MHSWLAADRVISVRRLLALVAVFAVFAIALPMAHAQAGQPAPASPSATAPTSQAPTEAPTDTAPKTEQEAGGESSLKLPDMSSVSSSTESMGTAC